MLHKLFINIISLPASRIPTLKIVYFDDKPTGVEFLDELLTLFSFTLYIRMRQRRSQSCFPIVIGCHSRMYKVNEESDGSSSRNSTSVGLSSKFIIFKVRIREAGKLIILMNNICNKSRYIFACRSRHFF